MRSIQLNKIIHVIWDAGVPAFEIRNCSIHGNKAAKGAAVMYAHPDAELTMGGVMRIYGNTASATECGGSFLIKLKARAPTLGP